MKKKIQITCVLPNYNNLAFLARTMDSLINQTYKFFEIIVVDDASSDGSDDLLKYYERENDNIRVIKNTKRKGAAYCRNLGNSLAKGKYIAVCDSGDVNHKNRLVDAINFFKENKHISIYSTACVETNVLDEQIEAHFPRIFNDNEKPSLFHPTVVYKKEVADKIKYREGNLSTDQYEAFFFEAYRNNYKFWFSSEAMVKKLRQKGDYDHGDIRMKQRIKNYEEFGIKEAS